MSTAGLVITDFAHYFPSLVLENASLQSFTDVCLQAGVGEDRDLHHVHRAILATYSPLLNQLLLGVNDERDICISFADVSCDVVQSLVKLLYDGSSGSIGSWQQTLELRCLLKSLGISSTKYAVTAVLNLDNYSQNYSANSQRSGLSNQPNNQHYPQNGTVNSQCSGVLSSRPNNPQNAQNGTASSQSCGVRGNQPNPPNGTANSQCSGVLSSQTNNQQNPQNRTSNSQCSGVLRNQPNPQNGTANSQRSGVFSSQPNNPQNAQFTGGESTTNRAVSSQPSVINQPSPSPRVHRGEKSSVIDVEPEFLVVELSDSDDDCEPQSTIVNKSKVRHDNYTPQAAQNNSEPTASNGLVIAGTTKDDNTAPNDVIWS